MFIRQAAAFCRDDSGRDGVVQTKGRADGGHPFSDLDVVGVAETNCREVLSFDLNQCDIGFRVRSDDLSFELTFIGETDCHVICVFNDMIICEDVSVRANDET